MELNTTQLFNKQMHIVALSTVNNLHSLSHSQTHSSSTISPTLLEQVYR